MPFKLVVNRIRNKTDCKNVQEIDKNKHTSTVFHAIPTYARDTILTATCQPPWHPVGARARLAAVHSPVKAPASVLATGGKKLEFGMIMPGYMMVI